MLERNTSLNKKVTIKDIARIANVSPSTVSMVINDKPGVGAETKYRVLKIVEALNYSPNLVAVSLVKRRSYAVAMLITNTRNPIFPEMAGGVDEVLKEYGYSLSIISTYDDEKIEAKEIEKIRARGMDGIITSAALINDENLKSLAKSGYPVVSVLRRVYDCDELDYVNVDNVRGGFLAAEHLIRLGHKRVGIITGPQNTSTGVERLQGAIKAFGVYGLPLPDAFIHPGDYFKESGYVAAKALLGVGSKQRASALFACNDDMALGAFEAIYDMGLKIPEEVALVGFNNVETTSLRTLAITTITQRKQEMGRLAAKRLIDKIEKNKGHEKPYRVVLDPELIIRKSCGYSLSSKYVVEAIKGPHS